MNTKPIVDWGKKNWKSIAFVLIIAVLILFNVRQYQGSQKIVRENQKINEQYQAMLGREIIYNQQIAEYRTQLSKKDSAIAVNKQQIEITEGQLSLSQSEVRKLSKKILNGNTVNQDSLQAYVKNCDSLANVAPVLADQVDTLKSQNKSLVTTMEQKSSIQDSIIKKKDIIITDKQEILDKTLDGYNKATEKLVATEVKLNKEKKKKNFWMKVSIIVAGIAGGIIATK